MSQCNCNQDDGKRSHVEIRVTANGYIVELDNTDYANRLHVAETLDQLFTILKDKLFVPESHKNLIIDGNIPNLSSRNEELRYETEPTD